MAAITIRNLADDVVEALKLRAKANGRSMEAEARDALARVAGGNSGLEELLRTRLASTRQHWLTGSEIMARVDGMPPETTDWGEENREHRADDPVEDPWEHRASA
jgi:plasmid stability protein